MQPRTIGLVMAALFAATPSIAGAQTNAAEVGLTPQGGQVVATATGAPAPPAPAADPTVAWLAQEPSLDNIDAWAVRDHAVHGEFSVGVGTRGYRQIGGAVAGPLGDDGWASIAIDAAEIGGRR